MELRLWRPQGGARTAPTRIRLTDEWASHGKRSLRVEAGEGNRPGVSFSAGRQDWRGYEALVADLFCPEAGQPRSQGARPVSELVLRVDAEGEAGQSARFQRGFAIASGLNTLRVPLEEIAAGTGGVPLDLSAVRHLVLLLNAEPQSRTFTLDSVRLEPGG